MSLGIPVGKQFIKGQWEVGQGASLQSRDPTTSNLIWTGQAADQTQVQKALTAARCSLLTWSALAIDDRIIYLEKFREQLLKDKSRLSKALALDVGKPLWEAENEVLAMANKIAISINAYNERTPIVEKNCSGMVNATRYKPQGVMAILGPFNFPGHLPNGQLIPALLAGNTIIWKPSELVPLASEAIMKCWEKIEIPPGVINLLQGGPKVGQMLANSDINGLFFTGSYQTGQLLHQAFAGYPEKLLILEMGGNNPLVVHQVKDLKAASYCAIQSAFLTAGQRCSCARRLIVPDTTQGHSFINELIQMTAQIQVGRYDDDPQPFMGAVITAQVARELLVTQESLLHSGGVGLLPMKSLAENTGLLSPGLIDVTEVENLADREIFGPLLQIIRCKDFQAAIAIANQTQYGLTAGLLSDNKALYREFYTQVQAGIINWNKPLTGAANTAPFGGIGKSGNYRPGAYFMADSCVYPVASMETPHLLIPEKRLPGINLDIS